MFGLEIGLSELNENSEFVAVSHSGALSLFNDMLQRKYEDHFFSLKRALLSHCLPLSSNLLA